jgi:hypothetical protein
MRFFFKGPPKKIADLKKKVMKYERANALVQTEVLTKKNKKKRS